MRDRGAKERKLAHKSQTKSNQRTAHIQQINKNHPDKSQANECVVRRSGARKKNKQKQQQPALKYVDTYSKWACIYIKVRAEKVFAHATHTHIFLLIVSLNIENSRKKRRESYHNTEWVKERARDKNSDRKIIYAKLFAIVDGRCTYLYIANESEQRTMYGELWLTTFFFVFGTVFVAFSLALVCAFALRSLQQIKYPFYFFASHCFCSANSILQNTWRLQFAHANTQIDTNHHRGWMSDARLLSGIGLVFLLTPDLFYDVCFSRRFFSSFRAFKHSLILCVVRS